MQKIITLFQRNYETDRFVRDEVVPGAEWVLEGEGVATRKWDGTCCLVKSGKLYKRYELKSGKAAPNGFEPAQAPDPVTGDCPGWLPVVEGTPEDRWFVEAWNSENETLPDGTYELVGPKVQGNPDNFGKHTLVPHGKEIIENVPRTFEGLKDYLFGIDFEGIVWHHPDGRMVKLKKRDFWKKQKPSS